MGWLILWYYHIIYCQNSGAILEGNLVGSFEAWLHPNPTIQKTSQVFSLDSLMKRSYKSVKLCERINSYSEDLLP